MRRGPGRDRRAPSGAIPHSRLRMAVLKEGKGKRAVTHFRVLERFGAAAGAVSLIECRLETGRTHQIRVHLASLGHPLLGDDTYRGRRAGAGGGRPADRADRRARRRGAPRGRSRVRASDDGRADGLFVSSARQDRPDPVSSAQQDALAPSGNRASSRVISRLVNRRPGAWHAACYDGWYNDTAHHRHPRGRRGQAHAVEPAQGPSQPLRAPPDRLSRQRGPDARKPGRRRGGPRGRRGAGRGLPGDRGRLRRAEGAPGHRARRAAGARGLRGRSRHAAGPARATRRSCRTRRSSGWSTTTCRPARRPPC